MSKQVYIVDPVVFIPSGVSPTGGFFDSIGSIFSSVGSAISSTVGTVASSLGQVIKSPVVSKLLQGGLALGGSVLLAKQAQKQQTAQLAATQTLAQTTATAAATAQAEADASAAKTKKILLYAGAGVLAVGAVWLVLSSRRKSRR